MESLLSPFNPTVVKTLEFGNMYVQYVFENGKFWLNATDLIKGILKISLPTIQRLKENEFRTLEDSRAEKVFVEWTILEKLFRTKLNDGKQEKTDTFEDFVEDGGFEKMMLVIHQKENVEFLTIDLLKEKLDAANERAVNFENQLTDSIESNTEKDRQLAAYLTDCINLKQLKDVTISERDEFKQNFNAVTLTVDGQNALIVSLKDEICVKDQKIGEIVDEKDAEIEKINADHKAENDFIRKEADAKVAKLAEENAAKIAELNAEHEKTLKPLLERSNLRKFWLDRDASLYAQIALQIVCMAFMFPLIHKHYPFTNYPTWLGIVFDTMLTAMLPIASILFSLRKRNDWLWGIFAFEVLFSNSQTELFNPYLGENIHFVENLAVTFFLPLLLVAFGTLTAKRETNKALLVKADE